MSATKEELTAAMGRLYDALMFMRGPTGEVIYVGEKALQMAFHLARAGADVDPDAAIIKARPIPARPGQMPGMVDWVPVDWPDPPQPNAESITATGPTPDPSAFDDLIAWHTRTRIEGNFA
jgi:hypothetical protein